jgi:hypothetical protein
MPLSTLLWLALLVILAMLFVATLRRTSTLVHRTRTLERIQHSVDDIDRRFAEVVIPLIRNLDETRRHAGDPLVLSQDAAQAQAVLGGLIGEARALDVPPGLAAEKAVMAGELERAARAMSMVEHGLGVMTNYSRGRDLEAQTSLKREALNLRHAHDAFARVARDIAALRPPDLVAKDAAATTAPSVIETCPGADPDDPEEPFDPRM